MDRINTKWLHLIGIILILNACTSGKRNFKANPKASPLPQNSSAPDPDAYKIIQVTPVAKDPAKPVGADNPLGLATVLFKSQSGKTNNQTPLPLHTLNQACNTLDPRTPAAKPCICVYRWEEKNRTGLKPVPIQREVSTPVNYVQDSLVTCPLPPSYQHEIAEGSKITLLVQRASTSLLDFESQAFLFKKQTPGPAGSFQDLQGNEFDNILRYSCYEKIKKGMVIQNRKVPADNQPPDKPKVQFLSASRFCLSKADGDGSQDGGEGCESLPGPEWSAESFYYNLFIPNPQRGKINQDNLRYKCPRVKENLRGTSQPDFWPLDTHFALSRHRSEEFIVGVEAFSNLAIEGGDASSLATSCTEVQKKGAQNNNNAEGDKKIEPNSLVKKCLGFALKPSEGGTCPSFLDLNNRKVQTYRLRRYVALYPPSFDTDGKMRNEPQGTDIVYVIDRPVKKPPFAKGDSYTHLGPKPCPFAYFDHKGVSRASVKPAYLGTNSIAWYQPFGKGVNIDGIEFPNGPDSENSCSAAIPLFNPNTQLWSVGTVSPLNLNMSNMNGMNRVFIRPQKPWAPHYNEDTDFQACAPLAQPFIDAPLHFARNSQGNIAWCAEAYPTQNPNRGIDPVSSPSLNNPNRVKPFTSHVLKNVQYNGQENVSCNATTISFSNYSGPENKTTCTEAGHSTIAAARHPLYLVVDTKTKEATSCGNGGTQDGTQCTFCSHLTCDRTVVSGQDQPWVKFPLLAPPQNVEAMLKIDPSYACTLTYDEGGGKTGKLTPKGGCCGGSVRLRTGLAANVPSPDEEIKNEAAHLEPIPGQNTCPEPEY